MHSAPRLSYRATMSFLGVPVVAVEGPHGSGKTTLVGEVRSALALRGTLATVVPEQARISEFFDPARLEDGGIIDHRAELHLLGLQVAAEQEASLVGSVLLCDRTILNAISYWRARLSPVGQTIEDVYLGAQRFAQIYAKHAYDRVYFLTDNYLTEWDPRLDINELFRNQVEGFLYEDLTDSGVDFVSVERQLSQPERIELIATDIWQIQKAMFQGS